MNFRTVFAVHQPVTSSTECILQFWQRLSRTAENSARTSFALSIVRSYGDSAAKVNSQQFSWTPPGRASACFAKRFSQTVSWWCPLDSAFAVESDVQYFRRKTELQKFWTEKIIVRVFSYRAAWVTKFWIFHARMHEIRKSETNLQFTQTLLKTQWVTSYTTTRSSYSCRDTVFRIG